MDVLKSVVAANPFATIAVLAFTNFTVRAVTDSYTVNAVALVSLICAAFIVGIISKRSDAGWG